MTGGIANWDRSQASALMEQWLEEYPGEIELVISNNDEMALGAIEAIERVDAGGAGRDIRLVGIDATPDAVEAVRDYAIPGTDVRHRLIVVEKVKKTPEKYPRMFAKIKKNPL